MFYLGALRDVSDEFAPRSSQFWARLLRALEIPADVESDAMRVLDRLNQRLLKADPRLEAMANTLSGATRIAARDREGGLALRMAPLKTRDLLSRAEIILRNEPDSPWLPLRRQGQGIQSLSVIFLFQVFVEHLLNELYEVGSEPLLALEEPETHLHPQAVRTLWHHIGRLPGQKVVTTHSPYFVQNVPFRDLRLVRLTPNGTTVRSLPASFSTSIPRLDGLDEVVASAGELLAYEHVSETLTVHGALDRSTYRKLLFLCGSDENRSELERKMRNLKERSALHIKDEDLRALQTQARRMRGEIFFAERWLIVEGQVDYLIVHATAHGLGYDLDRHGVSVIDAKNSGDPATFAALARALDVPWLAVFDGDDEGRKMKRSIGRREFPDDELQERCRTHPVGDLEAQLVADGLEAELRDVLATIGISNADRLRGDGLVASLRDNKTAYAAELAARIRLDPGTAQRMPTAFRRTIEQMRGLS